ncbi:MAG: hypothetical protein ACP5PP_04415 [Fervidobacterium sp.]
MIDLGSSGEDEENKSSLGRCKVLDYFEKLLHSVKEDLKEEFLKRKKLQEENFSEFKDAFAEIFWEIFLNIAENLTEDSPMEQKLFIRTGIVDPRYLTKEDLERLKVLIKSEESDTIFYADEWILAVKSGKIPRSTFEDVIQEKGQERTVDVSWIEKEYERKIYDRTIEEEKLKDLANGVQGKGPYSKGVYYVFDEILKSIGRLKKLDGEIKTLKELLDKAQEQKNLLSKENLKGTENHFTEHLVIRQMIKKVVGKMGINYPALTSVYLKDVNKIFSKQLVTQMLDEYKTIDPKTLTRNIRGTEIFMPPYVILVPGYGENGFCWEPIEGLNIYGRGRIVVPIFSRKGNEPFFMALGEYRWKLEKELSFGRWMEEGLTGEYYKYLEDSKIKGNPAEHFVKDYVLWVSKEVNGVQKLEKPVREIFWRYIPFDVSIKEKLSHVSYVYQQLWEKDLRKRGNQE